jgi:hypothetical protein
MSIEPVINKQQSLFVLVIAHVGFVTAGRVSHAPCSNYTNLVLKYFFKIIIIISARRRHG